MNKTHWLGVLDGSATDETVKGLPRISYGLTKGKV